MKLPLLTEDAICRILRDLLRGELLRMRGMADGDTDFPRDTVFRSAPWHLDSMEIMELTARVNEFFHLYKTGLEDNLLRHKKLEQWVEMIFLSWQEHPEEITFRTSGSTGKPVARTHSMDRLMQEAGELAGIFEGRRHIISFVPAHHIYGFIFTVLLPAQMGIDVTDGRDMGIGSLARGIAPGDLLISFPRHWSFLERSLPGWPKDVRGVSSTGPADASLIRNLMEKGMDRFTEIYGSSAHGGMGYRHDPEQPYALFSYLCPSESSDSVIRTLPDGRREKCLAEDILKWEKAGTFHVLRRRDRAVQVGGINVYPEAVAGKMRQHPLVADCAVRLMNDTDHPRLKVFIIPAQETERDLLRGEIRAWMQQNLSAAERPVHLRFGRELPKNDMGKNRDWETD